MISHSVDILNWAKEKERNGDDKKDGYEENHCLADCFETEWQNNHCVNHLVGHREQDLPLEEDCHVQEHSGQRELA